MIYFWEFWRQWRERRETKRGSNFHVGVRERLLGVIFCMDWVFDKTTMFVMGLWQWFFHTLVKILSLLVWQFYTFTHNSLECLSAESWWYQKRVWWSSCFPGMLLLLLLFVYYIWCHLTLHTEHQWLVATKRVLVHVYESMFTHCDHFVYFFPSWALFAVLAIE